MTASQHDAVEEVEEPDPPLSSVSIRGRSLCNLQFADDIDLLGRSEDGLQQLIQRLEETATEYDMEISSDMSKLSSIASSQDHLPTCR